MFHDPNSNVILHIKHAVFHLKGQGMLKKNKFV